MEKLIKHANGQWDLVEKSNYGPKKAKLYNPADNAKRKMNNTGDVLPSSTNSNVKEYTSNVRGTAVQQANKEAREAKRKSKGMPVRIFTPEEKAALAAEMADKENKLKKEELTLSKNGQWTLR
jgi:hypothetical protein